MVDNYNSKEEERRWGSEDITVEEEEEEEEWGTLEELLLASAVKRHGTDSWESVASLLRGPHIFSPDKCRRKYLQLLRRFSNPDLLIHHLRNLRVLHLQHHLHLHDLHILSLEEKVKTLERGDSNNNIVVRDVDEPPDPRDHKRDSAEDRSCNESNSSKDPVVKGHESKRADIININININIRDLQQQQQQQQQPQEQSSDVQSSANLTRKRRRRIRVGINSSGDELSESPGNQGINIKSQPLIRFLDLVFSHKHASAFHRRLPTQETEKYRNVVRQYMDLDMVQSRLDRGIYNECHLQFYRDLLLIFTNAVLFYCKSSAEHIAAREMRKVVMEEITLRTHKPKVLPTNPDPEPHHHEPVVKKPRSSTTMVVCRRRSSIQGLSESMVKKEESLSVTLNSSIKNNNNIANSKMGNGGEEMKPKGDEREKKVDGGSSSNSNVLVSRKEKEGDKGDGVSNSSKFLSRERSSLGRGTLRLSDNNNKKIISKDGNKREKIENGNSSYREGSSNGEGDEPEEKTKKNIDQKQDKVILKKQGVANFLKRIKQNSPSGQEKVINNHSDGDEDDDDRNDQPVKKEKTGGNGKKTGGINARKNSSSKVVDVVGTGRSSGRKGEKEGAASSRAIGRPPKRKAAMMGTPDSGKGGKSGAGISRKKPRR